MKGFYTVYLYISQGDVRTIIAVLWTALAVIVQAEILRFQSPKFERVYERCLGFLMRESEKVRLQLENIMWHTGPGEL
jgi:diacylglycerol kinase (CTP)